MEIKGSRIYFAPNGIGLGHVSRSVTVAEEAKRRGAEVFFSTYLEGVEYVERRGFPVARAPELSMVNDETGAIDVVQSGLRTGVTAGATFMRQVEFEMQQIRSFDAGVVVSDSRLSSIAAAVTLRLPVVTILNQFSPMVPREKDSPLYRVADGGIMTLLGGSWSLSGRVLIPDFPEPYTLSTDTLRIPDLYRGKVDFIGAILQRKPGDLDTAAVRRQLGVRDGEKLIFAGISGPAPERLPLLQALEPILVDFPEGYRVVMSMGNPSGGTEPELKGRLIKVPWVEDRWSLLEACDAVISRGGHETLMQSICYGKPSVVIPVTNHPEQHGNARRAESIGAAKHVPQRDLSGESLLSAVHELESEKYRAKMAELKGLHLGDGVDRCIEAIRNARDWSMGLLSK